MRPLVAWLCSLVLGQAQYTGPPPELEISPPFLSEELLRARRVKDINLTLVGGGGGGWAAGIGVDEIATEEWLYHAMRGEGAQPLAWQATVAPHFRPWHVIRKSNFEIQLLLMGFDGTGWYPDFDVSYEEAVSIGAPWWATANNVSAVPPYSNVTVRISTPRVTAFGELIGQSVPTASLREQTHEVILALEGCDWHLDAGRAGSPAYEALSSALVGPNDAEMTSGRSGWQLAGSGMLKARRENASHLTLIVPPLPAYRISSPETVRVTVPAAALLQHHVDIRQTDYSFVALATPGRAKLGGSLLHKNASTRLAPPTIASKSLEVRLIADTWLPAVDSDESLRRAIVLGMRSDQNEEHGWNALIGHELSRDGGEWVMPEGGGNATYVGRGIGNLSLALSDESTLSLTLPAEMSYTVRQPETVRVVVPAAALTSQASEVEATPALRIDAVGGSASLRGTFIADTHPATFRNLTTRRSISIALPSLAADAEGYAWWPMLADGDSPRTLALLRALADTFLLLNDTAYDVFDNICSNETADANATLPFNGTNATLLANVTNATSVLEELLSQPLNASLADINMTNASAVLAILLNATNATNVTNITVPTPHFDFCLSLVNASIVNGSLVVHSTQYSPYCDPCLSARTIQPLPFNHTFITLSDNFSMIIDVPEDAGVRVTERRNVTIPPLSLVSHPSMEYAPADANVRLELHVLIEQVTLTDLSDVFFGHNDEASLRAGPELGGWFTLDIELTDDTWDANISSPEGRAGAGMDLVLGISSMQSESNGWNSIVRSRLTTEPNVLVRVSDTMVSVRLAGFPEYDILSAETVRVTVPGSAVVSERVIEASNDVAISPVRTRALCRSPCECRRPIAACPAMERPMT